MKKIAVIVAGGIGIRMNSDTPKQFMLLDGKPILYYSIATFLDAYEDMEIVLVLPVEYVSAGQEIIDAFFDYKRIKITEGGRTRFHSVQNALKLIEEECIVFVHDAVRCMLSTSLIRNCYEAVLTYGSAIPVIDSKDSLRLLTEEGNEALERSFVKLVQTPQAFYSKILLPAFNIDYKDKYTDEATVVEAFGLKVYLVPGEQENIKITNANDLFVAENYIKKKKGEVNS